MSEKISLDSSDIALPFLLWSFECNEESVNAK